MVEFKKYNLVIELHNYPSDISREQFEIIRYDLKMQRKKHVRVHTTCTMFFVPFSICFVAECSGECCPQIFRVGNWFITTSKFGQNLMKTASAFWTKFEN